MSESFQAAVLDALENEATVLNTASNSPSLRVIMDRKWSNAGTLHVLHGWDEVVRVTFDFQHRRATLIFDHDPNTMLGGPASDTVFHLTPSNSQETKRMLAAWHKRIDTYRANWRVGNL